MSLQVVRGTDGQHHFVGGIAEQRERMPEGAPLP